MGAIGNLSLDSIVDGDALNLFDDDETQESTTPEEESKSEVTEDSDSSENNKENENVNTIEVDPKNLFDDATEEVESKDKIPEDKPESVDSEEAKNKGDKDATLDESSDSSNNDFFSSIATAFVVEGILPNLDDDSIKKVKTAEDLRKVIDDHIKSELDEKQKRVLEALDNNIQPDEIKQYETVINNLNNVSEDFLREESDNAANARKSLIYQDYINRGFSEDRAKREVEKSIKSGTDIEESIEALASNKDYYTESYNDVIEEARKSKNKELEDTKRKSEEIKKNLMDGRTTFFGDLNPDKATRQKIYDNITKPVYKDKETGRMLTAVQKYEKDHGQEFYAKIGILYTLTDGFENLNGLTKDKVKKEIKRGFKDLESKIKHTDRSSYGNMKYASGSAGVDGLGEGVELLTY